MPDLNKFYTWCIQTCNAPDVGYSMDYRAAQTVGGITYYDCSSFVYLISSSTLSVNSRSFLVSSFIILPEVSRQVFMPFWRQDLKISIAIFVHISGSPPESVIPPSLPK